MPQPNDKLCSLFSKALMQLEDYYMGLGLDPDSICDMYRGSDRDNPKMWARFVEIENCRKLNEAGFV